MTPKTHSAGGETMLAVIALAVIVVVVAEAEFVAFASWWMVPCLLFGVLVATAVVIYTVLRTIETDPLVPVEPRAKLQAAPMPAPRPVRGAILAGR